MAAMAKRALGRMTGQEKKSADMIQLVDDKQVQSDQNLMAIQNVWLLRITLYILLTKHFFEF